MRIEDRGMVLSTLWIFNTLNYLYCDVLSLMSPEMLNSLIATGGVGGITMSETTLLGAAILLEIPIALVFLSRLLKRKANRRVNIVGGMVMTLVMVGSLLVGEASYHYIFFATIEIATSLFVVWFAWTWAEPQAAAG